MRILLAKPGLDGHDRGVHVIARTLRDAGHEVIVTGRFWSPEAIADAAVEEDVAVVGLSILAGGHLGLSADVRAELDAREATCALLVGGTIPVDDEAAMLAGGCDAVFPVGSQLSAIVDWLAAYEEQEVGS
jgi:methylmalonyl-CoA mutase C-terminal domain/subunit